jgi:type II secretory ATPase GspE/PulE/Tfp pilus assembly ATPase PilB-like protein
MLAVDDSIRGLIQTRQNASDIRRQALTRGMRTLKDDGTRKALEGRTTVEEVLRVTVTAD